jgi:hypothetical protein
VTGSGGGGEERRSAAEQRTRRRDGMAFVLGARGEARGRGRVYDGMGLEEEGRRAEQLQPLGSRFRQGFSPLGSPRPPARACLPVPAPRPSPPAALPARSDEPSRRRAVRGGVRSGQVGPVEGVAASWSVYCEKSKRAHGSAARLAAFCFLPAQVFFGALSAPRRRRRRRSSGGEVPFLPRAHPPCARRGRGDVRQRPTDVKSFGLSPASVNFDRPVTRTVVLAGCCPAHATVPAWS